jgi:hypothetical protein
MNGRRTSRPFDDFTQLVNIRLISPTARTAAYDSMPPHASRRAYVEMTRPGGNLAALRDAKPARRSRAHDPHKVRGELSVRRLVLAGREERMVLSNDLEVLSLDNAA